MERRVVSEDLEAGTRRMSETWSGGCGSCCWGEMLIDGKWVKHGHQSYSLTRPGGRNVIEQIFDKGEITYESKYIEIDRTNMNGNRTTWSLVSY